MAQNTPGASGNNPGIREANYIASALMPAQMALLTTITHIVVIILGWLSISLEVFLRYDFGDRYLSWLRLYFAYAAMSWAIFVPALFGASITGLYGLYFLAFLGLSLWHRLRIWLRYKNRVLWHSMSFGVSRLADLNLPYIGNDDWKLYLWIEPGLCLAISFVVYQIDNAMGSYLFLASVALLIKNRLVYQQQRNRVLDLIDGYIEGQYYNEAALGKRKDETAGHAVVPVVFPVTPEGESLDIEATVKGIMTAPEHHATVVSPSEPPPDFSATLADTLKVSGDAAIPPDTDEADG